MVAQVPSFLDMPRPAIHRLRTDVKDGQGNPLISGKPDRGVALAQLSHSQLVENVNSHVVGSFLSMLALGPACPQDSKVFEVARPTFKNSKIETLIAVANLFLKLRGLKKPI